MKWHRAAGRMPLRPQLIGHILRLSLPMSIQMVVCCIGSLIVQTAINRFDVTFVAGYTASNKLYGLLEVAAIAYGFAITTYISQNTGAGDRQRLLAGIVSGERIALLTSLGLMLMITLWKRPLVQLFITGQAEAMRAAAVVSCESLMALTIGLPLLYSLYVFKSVLQGLGDAHISSASSVGEFISRVFVAFLASHMHEPKLLYLSEPLAWGIGTSVLLFGVLHYIHMWKSERKS